LRSRRRGARLEPVSKKPTIGNIAMPLSLRHAAATDIGRVRQGNEDSFYADDEANVFVVADGMGGHAAGEVAAQIAASRVGEALSGAIRTQLAAELAQTLEAAIAEANRRILSRAQDDPDCYGMGTTITALCVLPDASFLIGHVGDSRAYRLRGGSLKRITKDHTLVQQEVDRGTLTDEQARVHPRSNVLTRALGIPGGFATDLYEGTLEAGDRVLLATDGLSAMLADAEIERILAAALDVEATAGQLVERANAAGGLDNTTVIVIDVVET
jgi:protein phosphatase